MVKVEVEMKEERGERGRDISLENKNSRGQLDIHKW